jgi:hypothetical protein
LGVEGVVDEGVVVAVDFAVVVEVAVGPAVVGRLGGDNFYLGLEWGLRFCLFGVGPSTAAGTPSLRRGEMQNAE